MCQVKFGKEKQYFKIFFNVNWSENIKSFKDYNICPVLKIKSIVILLSIFLHFEKWPPDGQKEGKEEEKKGGTCCLCRSVEHVVRNRPRVKWALLFCGCKTLHRFWNQTQLSLCL